MAKILQTRLPTAMGSVEPDLYNRMIRVLEISLGRFDPTATPQYNDTEIGQNKFAAGDVIWNTSKSVLQVYLGNEWQDLSTRTEVGVVAKGKVGSVTVATNGSTTIDIGGAVVTGWNTEQWYT
tara:strand:- start:224 stop:592 length:369 start_codon:yes stop_codon:yes gene_type:complete